MAKQKTTPAQMEFSLVNEHAAGIDVGSRTHWVSIGTLEGQTREYGVFTDDLHAMCQWLKSEGIRTVALESTGFYWKQLFLMLQSYGMEVCLVNASYTKNVRGRKPSDLADSQWIWKLHSVGLLTASFQPSFFTEELRTYTRHRKRLIEDASRCTNKIQKCLIMMNIQLPIVISDVTGKSGTAIIEAILSGERDGKKLAALANGRLRADKKTLARALTGIWQESQLFELEQHWQSYQHYQRQLAQCDQRIDAFLRNHVESTGQAELVYEPQKKSGDRRIPPHSK
ncbi:MAG: hypothetical protein D6816_05420 [Bacteroidetes bacterium]|nr:MAG: hypothetical protein D6816_05420 [Bacteroidota bacterium]